MKPLADFKLGSWTGSTSATAKALTMQAKSAAIMRNFWIGGHVKGADHVFIGTLEKNLSKIKKDQQVIIHCQAGDRASIGYSLLAKHGFKNVKNYSGGINEWVNTGYAVVTEN